MIWTRAKNVKLAAMATNRPINSLLACGRGKFGIITKAHKQVGIKAAQIARLKIQHREAKTSEEDYWTVLLATEQHTGAYKDSQCLKCPVGKCGESNVKVR